MIANGGDTEGLFRAGFMQSGSPIPHGDTVQGQWSYNEFVMRAGCQNATDSLQCLREAPYETLKAAMDASASILSEKVSTEQPRGRGCALIYVLIIHGSP
jgi:acetylcholinesterase